MKRKIDLQEMIFSIVLLVIGVILFISSMSLPTGGEMDLGADLMPKIISCLLMIISAIFAISAFLPKKVTETEPELSPEEAAEKSNDKISTIRFLIAFGFFFCYIFFLKSVGFIIMTVLYIIVQSWFTTPKEKRNPVLLIIIAVVATVFIYGIFVFGLKVILPAGILG